MAVLWDFCLFFWVTEIQLHNLTCSQKKKKALAFSERIFIDHFISNDTLKPHVCTFLVILGFLLNVDPVRTRCAYFLTYLISCSSVSDSHKLDPCNHGKCLISGEAGLIRCHIILRTIQISHRNLVSAMLLKPKLENQNFSFFYCWIS